MAYVRRKRLKGHDYYYLVASHRQDGKVKTRTLKYLGTTPNVPAQCQYLLESRRGHRQGLLWTDNPAMS
ncbi:MAG: hypothetical protein WC381_06590 [Kiritimatiellia bacterium]|jgi:hypothetical protein